MQSLARWSYRHRKLVVVGWIALLVALGAVSNKVGNAYSDNFDLPGVESVKALELLKERAPASSGESAQVVFASKDGATLKDGANKRSIDALVAKLSAMPHVAAVHSPYDGAQPTISADGTVGFATLNFDQLADKLPVKAIRDVVKTAQAAESSTLRIELGGSVIQYADQGKPPATEAIGLLVAAAVLFITFGSLVAMAVPLLVAVIALGTGLSLIGLLTHLMNVAQFAPTLAALIGLGVGID